MNVPPAKPLEVVEGETIEASATQPLGFNLYEFEWKKVLVFSVIYLLGCCAAWSWWTGNPAAQGAPGVKKLALFVILLPLVFLFRAFRTMGRQQRGEKLILGKDRLQQVTKQGQVLTQFPYRNVAHIEFVSEPGKEKYIGIDLSGSSGN